MTARTHDLFAFTAGILALTIIPINTVDLGTAIVSLGGLFLGGMAPDLDEPGAQFWQRIPAGAGTILGRVVSPIFGSHRFISHSILGVAIFAWLAKQLLIFCSGFLVVDVNTVIVAFVLGMVSHLIADGLTREGVPLFFPIPVKLGFPPFKRLRIVTGGFMEKGVVFPGLVLFNGWWIYGHYQMLVELLRGIK